MNTFWVYLTGNLLPNSHSKSRRLPFSKPISEAYRAFSNISFISFTSAFLKNNKGKSSCISVLGSSPVCLIARLPSFACLPRAALNGSEYPLDAFSAASAKRDFQVWEVYLQITLEQKLVNDIKKKKWSFSCSSFEVAVPSAVSGRSMAAGNDALVLWVESQNPRTFLTFNEWGGYGRFVRTCAS